MEQLHIIPHKHKITLLERMQQKGHKPLLIWFTGLSGSGKSTLAGLLEQQLHERKMHTYLLDGDNVRKGLNKDLGFSEDSRVENIRRIGEMSKLMLDAGLVVMAAFVSPYKEDREKVKELVGEDNFVEIYVDCPVETCEERDVKGLYKLARKGEIKNFTGISAPFEVPEQPDVHVLSGKESLEKSLAKIGEAIFPKLQL